MTVELTVQTEGVRHALAELRRIDPTLQRQARADLKAAGSKLTARPKANYPLTPPLDNWSTRGRLGYSPGRVRAGVQAVVGGRVPRGSTVAPVITIVQRNAGGALYDIAGLRGGSRGNGSPQGQAFIRNLDGKYGPAQRGLWRARGWVYENAADALNDALDKVKADANRHLRET